MSDRPQLNAQPVAPCFCAFLCEDPACSCACHESEVFSPGWGSWQPVADEHKEARVKYLLIAAILACIVAANATLDTFGFWQIGWLLIPSGSLWAGLTFSLRDAIHETAGRVWVFVAIVLGAVVSALVDPFLALASGVAFLLGETADLCVYEPLRLRDRLWAVRLSGFVGSIVDSSVFLWLAPFPFSWNALAGVIVAKAVVVELTVWVVALWRRR